MCLEYDKPYKKLMRILMRIEDFLSSFFISNLFFNPGMYDPGQRWEMIFLKDKNSLYFLLTKKRPCMSSPLIVKVEFLDKGPLFWSDSTIWTAT